MKHWQKIPKKRLKKDHRRETITLDGRFWQRRRILKKKDEHLTIYTLKLYGKRRATNQAFYSFAELRGIIKGMFAGRLLTDDFIIPQNPELLNY